MFLFLRSLWKLLKAKQSQLAYVAVPLLLHCLTLPTGSDIFWRLVEDDFTNEEWKIRFAAGILIRDHLIFYHCDMYM